MKTGKLYWQVVFKNNHCVLVQADAVTYDLVKIDPTEMCTFEIAGPYVREGVVSLVNADPGCPEPVIVATFNLSEIVGVFNIPDDTMFPFNGLTMSPDSLVVKPEDSGS